MGTQFEIITGTYEEYLIGYIFNSDKKSLTQSFASHDHSSSIRCLAISQNYLASGASDDRIIIYDLKARKEHCMLTCHDSTITAVAFTNNHSHVISASQDGTLAITRVGNWQLEKRWDKAHKDGSILDITVHSSGKLALTLGTDGTIQTWNLVKGRVAYVINLKTKCKDPKSLEKILFGPDDTKFMIYGGRYTEVWNIEIGGMIRVIEHDQKVTCCAWLDDDTFCVGYDDGKIGTFCLKTETDKIKVGHQGRVKAVAFNQGYIVTASSTGEIKVWTSKLKELCKIATGCRITCLIIAKWIGKLKKEEHEAPEIISDSPIKKPVKSYVVVEVEGSSDEEGGEMSKKRKKNKTITKAKKIKKTIEPDEVEDKKMSRKKKKKVKTSIGNSVQLVNENDDVESIEKIDIKQNKLKTKKKKKRI